MDAKQACDKLNGFNFQNRYLVGMSDFGLLFELRGCHYYFTSCEAARVYQSANIKVSLVLYHQPEKMTKSKEDLAERQENLEKLKRQHGIE